jgi:hypothetical protein
VTHTGCLLTTIDDEIEKIGPGPQGCGEKSGHTSFSPLDGGPATVFGLGFISTPRTNACPRGPRVWPDFRSQRHPPQ